MTVWVLGIVFGVLTSGGKPENPNGENKRELNRTAKKDRQGHLGWGGEERVVANGKTA